MTAPLRQTAEPLRNTASKEPLTMTIALAQVRQSSNYATDLSTDLRRAIMTLYHAHWNDARIATELQIPISTVARFRAARVLAAK